jgi:hypothetical protein
MIVIPSLSRTFHTFQPPQPQSGPCRLPLNALTLAGNAALCPINRFSLFEGYADIVAEWMFRKTDIQVNQSQQLDFTFSNVTCQHKNFVLYRLLFYIFYLPCKVT